MKKISFAVAGVLVATFCIIACQHHDVKLEDSAKQYYQYFLEKDYLAVAQMLPGADTINEQEQECVARFMEGYIEMQGGLTKYEILKSEQHDSIGTVVAREYLGNGQTNDAEMHFVKRGGQWVMTY